MNKSMVTGLVIGVAVAIAASGIAGYKMLTKEVYADVVAVKEVTETVKTPREQCEQVAVQKQAPVKDSNKITGTVLGAVVGGVLGNQVGGGTGKTVATVAGAAAGGYAGNKIQGNMQKSDVTTVMETRCKTVYDASQRTLGYDVTYTLNGQQGTARMTFNPGARIPVDKDGKLVLTQPTAPAPAAATATVPAAPAAK
jgi:uncharacterized protein YcfJ